MASEAMLEDSDRKLLRQMYFTYCIVDVLCNCTCMLVILFILFQQIMDISTLFQLWITTITTKHNTATLLFWLKENQTLGLWIVRPYWSPRCSIILVTLPSLQRSPSSLSRGHRPLSPEVNLLSLQRSPSSLSRGHPPLSPEVTVLSLQRSSIWECLTFVPSSRWWWVSRGLQKQHRG